MVDQEEGVSHLLITKKLEKLATEVCAMFVEKGKDDERGLGQGVEDNVRMVVEKGVEMGKEFAPTEASSHAGRWGGPVLPPLCPNRSSLKNTMAN